MTTDPDTLHEQLAPELTRGLDKPDQQIYDRIVELNPEVPAFVDSLKQAQRTMYEAMGLELPTPASLSSVEHMILAESASHRHPSAADTIDRDTQIHLWTLRLQSLAHGDLYIQKHDTPYDSEDTDPYLEWVIETTARLTREDIRDRLTETFPEESIPYVDYEQQPEDTVLLQVSELLNDRLKQAHDAYVQDKGNVTLQEAFRNSVSPEEVVGLSPASMVEYGDAPSRYRRVVDTGEGYEIRNLDGEVLFTCTKEELAPYQTQTPETSRDEDVSVALEKMTTEQFYNDIAFVIDSCVKQEEYGESVDYGDGSKLDATYPQGLSREEQAALEALGYEGARSVNLERFTREYNGETTVTTSINIHLSGQSGGMGEPLIHGKVSDYKTSHDFMEYGHSIIIGSMNSERRDDNYLSAHSETARIASELLQRLKSIAPR